MEVCANSKSPKSAIHKLPEDFSFVDSDELLTEDETQEIAESLIDLRFIDISQQQEWNMSVADNSVFDFAANITSVGRQERERKEPDSDL